MRSRSRVRSLFVPLAIVGVLGARASPAPARTPRPPKTPRAGTEPAGTEAPRAPRHRPARDASRRPEQAPAAVLTAASRAPTSPAPRCRCSASRPRAAPEGDATVAALNEFAEANGMTITYVGTGTFEDDLGTQVSAGTPPDIARVPTAGIARLVREDRRCPAAARRRRRQRERELARRLDELRQRRRHAVRRAVQVRPQVARLVPAGELRRAVGYEVPETLDDFFALTEQMIAERRHAAVRRHRGRGRHRLAVHGLGRGVGPAQPGHRLLQPVVVPRGAVQLARDRRHDAAGHRPLEHRGHGVRRRRIDRQPRRSATTASRSSTATA